METKRSPERPPLSLLTPLSKGGKDLPSPLNKGGERDADKFPLNKAGKGDTDKFPLSKGDTGGFDKSVLKQRGLITTGFHLPYNPRLKEAARQLRKNLTPAERKIWYSYFRTFEYPVLKQRPIDNYIVDFYCPEYRLIVEVDGESHFTREGKLYDEERTKILEQYGLRVIRFLNEDVLKNLEGVVDRIEKTIESLRDEDGAERRKLTPRRRLC